MLPRSKYLTRIAGVLLVLLLCLVATWVLCRWILGRTAAAGSAAAVWALASMFSVGAFAWGMTLRPEPVVALLLLGVVACTVRFVERGTTAPLAIFAVLVALAVSAHPAGLLSVAPLLVAGRQVLALIERNLRPRDIVTRQALENAATVVAASVRLMPRGWACGSAISVIPSSKLSMVTFSRRPRCSTSRTTITSASCAISAPAHAPVFLIVKLTRMGLVPSVVSGSTWSWA